MKDLYMQLNQSQKIRLASFYHQKAYKTCMEERDYFKARVFYEKVLELDPSDELAIFNLDILKVIT